METKLDNTTEQQHDAKLPVSGWRMFEATVTLKDGTKRTYISSALGSEEEAKKIGDEIGVDWSKIKLEQFRKGCDIELEHGTIDPQTNVTNDDPIMTGKIALAHLKERVDYYILLDKYVENEEVKG